MPTKNFTCRNWCFTAFTIDPATWFDKTKMKYLVYQVEICPRTGREHFQGYVEFVNPTRLSALKKFDSSAHFEVRKGTRDEARDYCMKRESRKPDTEPIELAEWQEVAPGQRTDLHEIKEEILEGKSMEHVATNHFTQWVMYRRSFEEFQNLTFRSRSVDEPPIVTWIYGKSGSGKTRFVFDLVENKDDIWTNGDWKWFDGYRNQSIVLFDDIAPSECYPLTQFLRLTDRYPLQVPIKGGFVKWLPKYIYITSNYHPKDVWAYECETNPTRLEAILRRITIRQLGEVDKTIEQKTQELLFGPKHSPPS